MDENEPKVLTPFDIREAMSLKEAAGLAGRSVATIRQWVAMNDLGRLIGGRWMVSRVAFAMYMDANRKALAAYLSGDRTSELVIWYFRRAGLVAVMKVGAR